MADIVKKEEQNNYKQFPVVGISEADYKRQHDLRALAATLITSEQNLIHNRMTWMMTFQGLLFASFALTASTTNDPDIKAIITDIVPYAGMSVAIMTLYGIIAAFLAITRTKKNLKKKLDSFKVSDEMNLIPHGTPVASVLGRTTTYSFPIIIAVTWLIIANKVRKVKNYKKENKIEQYTTIQATTNSNSVLTNKENGVYSDSASVNSRTRTQQK